MTNRQWLASMSDGQLAKFIRSLHFDTCEACTYKEGCPGFGVEEDFCLLGVEQWLKQEHEGDGNEL